MERMTNTAFVLVIGLASLLLPLDTFGQDWQLVFSDEFDNGSMLDPLDWSYAVGGSGFGNNELQYYTENRAENARIENGILVIEALKEDFGGSAYTSARVHTSGKHDITYGRVEVRAKLPAGRGTWPAIWLLYTDNPYGNRGWPDNGEVDIMEHVGFDEGAVHGTIHTKAYNGKIGTQRGATINVADATTVFHEYAIEWTPNRIRFYVDDLHYFSYNREGLGWEKWPYDHSFHLILNVAIGGDWGGQQGVDDSIFPTRMEVDYVRFYEEANARPVVSMDGVADSSSFGVGETLTATAEASDASGSLDRVQFLQADGVLAEFTSPPYNLSVSDLAPGCYTVRARAIDNDGWTAETEPRHASVGDDCPRAPYLMRYHDVPGTIEAEYFDLGGSSVAYSDLDLENSGNGIRQEEAVDIEGSSDLLGGYNLTSMSNREWVEYTVDVAESGLYAATVRVASLTGGSFELFVDGVSKSGTVDIVPTGGNQVWRNGTVTFPMEAGVHVLRYQARSNGLNLNRIVFSFQGPTATESEQPEFAFDFTDVYPNPTFDHVAITVSLTSPVDVTVELFDVLGRRVLGRTGHASAAGRQNFQFDLSALPSGVYWTRVIAGGQRASRSIVVR